MGIGSVTDQKTPSVVDLGTDGDSNAYTATAIGTGFAHTCALLNDKSVKCWGGNHRGQLGNRDHANSNTPVAVELGSGRTATAIHVKGNHVCAILDDGTLLCWGRNHLGQLGNGTTTSSTSKAPTAVDLGEGRTATAVGGGVDHTCAILDDESTKCWGYNLYGQTGLPTAHRGDQPGEMGENLILVDLDIDKEEEVEGGPEFTLAMGQIHTCAIDENGALTCWGAAGNGRLGMVLAAEDTHACTDAGETTTVDCRKIPTEVNLGTGRSALEVALGFQHTCAVLDDGSLKCWGSNGYGQVGDGSTTERNTPTRVALGDGRSATGVSLGQQHTCALLDDGSVKCWGVNSQGQTGDGIRNLVQEPYSVTLPSGKTAVAIRGGGNFSCALLNDQSLSCWGSNSFGQLGNDDTSISATPVGVTLSGDKTPTDAELGLNHACAILDDNSLVCWGRNHEGQLGVGTGSNESCNFGGNNFNCVKTPTEVDLGADRTALAVDLGRHHTCAVLDNGSIVCWGENDFGQLGDGTTTNRNTPVAVTVPGGQKAKAISLGVNVSCATLEDNSVFCWGKNHFGQLLDGTTIDRYAPVRARL